MAAYRAVCSWALAQKHRSWMLSEALARALNLADAAAGRSLAFWSGWSTSRRRTPQGDSTRWVVGNFCRRVSQDPSKCPLH